MYINNLPFTETLQMAQRDLYDINTLLLKPLKKQQKNAKRKKTMWHIVSGTEHAIGITFGVLATIETYNQNYVFGGLYGGLMAIGATVAFNAKNIAKLYTDTEKQLNEKIATVQTAINIALPEKIHEIAEIARNIKHR